MALGDPEKDNSGSRDEGWIQGARKAADPREAKGGSRRGMESLKKIHHQPPVYIHVALPLQKTTSEI